jgi:hypothetical protein
LVAGSGTTINPNLVRAPIVPSRLRFRSNSAAGPRALRLRISGPQLPEPMRRIGVLMLYPENDPEGQHRATPRSPARARSARRGRCERSSHHGVEKRTAAHARRRLKRKIGGFWRAQLCTEVARPKTIRTSDPKFLVCRLAPGIARRFTSVRLFLGKWSRVLTPTPWACFVGSGNRLQRSGDSVHGLHQR